MLFVYRSPIAKTANLRADRDFVRIDEVDGEHRRTQKILSELCQQSELQQRAHDLRSLVSDMNRKAAPDQQTGAGMR